MKFFHFLLTLTIFSLFFAPKVLAQTQVPSEAPKEIVSIEVLAREDCGHCKAEKEFFADLQTRRSDFTVKFLDISGSKNLELWKQFTTMENLTKATPITLVGTKIVFGFASKETSGKIIETLIDQSKGKKSYTIEEFIVAGGSKGLGLDSTQNEKYEVCDDDGCTTSSNLFLVSVPFYGPMDVSVLSLPMLSVVLGFVDGFNPCAMWVLVTFLVVLMQVGSKKKMILFAGTFVLAEAVMYTLILTVWYNTWNFVGMDRIVTPIIGLLSIGGGCFFLYEWRKSNGVDDACLVVDVENKKKISTRVKDLVTRSFDIFTFFGIVGLALSVNVIEFACSIGIPQAFTKILEINQLSLPQMIAHIGLYISFYMLDDFIVFGLAIYSFEKIGLTTKYSRWANLIGGVLMLILGLLLIFKPSILIVG